MPRGKSRTAIVVVLVVAGLVGAVVLSGRAGGAGSQPPLSAAELAALPRHLAAHEAEANQLIDGSVDERLQALRGIPVVVNQWASWCPNCREEFPFFQRLSRAYRGRVAFLGLDSEDVRASAEAFLAKFPVSYPSIYDHSAAEASSIGGGTGWPTTIFFDRRGRRIYIRPGGYVTAEMLRADVEQYALGAAAG